MEISANWMNSSKDVYASDREEFAKVAADELGFLWVEHSPEIFYSIWDRLEKYGCANENNIYFYDMY